MTPFFEGYLPLNDVAGVSGGPERRTDIVALANGREDRNSVWRHGRRRYDVGAAFASPDAQALLIAFFEARRGRWQGFRFRDPLDAKSCAPTAAPGAFDSVLGVGDGATRVFQLVRAYGTGENVYLRTIVKPVAQSARIGVGGAELAPGAFGVDAATGLVTLAQAPGAGLQVTAGFVFDTPVRFDTDHLNLAPGTLSAIPLVEIFP